VSLLREIIDSSLDGERRAFLVDQLREIDRALQLVGIDRSIVSRNWLTEEDGVH
jgi:hypothetical protein